MNAAELLRYLGRNIALTEKIAVDVEKLFGSRQGAADAIRRIVQEQRQNRREFAELLRSSSSKKEESSDAL